MNIILSRARPDGGLFFEILTGKTVRLTCEKVGFLGVIVLKSGCQDRKWLRWRGEQPDAGSDKGSAGDPGNPAINRKQFFE